MFSLDNCAQNDIFYHPAFWEICTFKRDKTEHYFKAQANISVSIACLSLTRVSRAISLCHYISK
jgi:hypothetical protein